MEFKKYQHIEKYGTSETEDILKGEVHLTYKIDGTNGCVYLKDGELCFGSRNRELTLDFDNCKFVELITKDSKYINSLKTYLSNHPNHIIYGEWLVPVNIKRYNKDAWHKFYIFDIYDSDSNTYLSIKTYLKEIKELGLFYIPEIAVLTNPTEEDVKEYLSETGNFLIDNGLGEGIVIKNYEYRNIWGRQVWAKMLTEDFIKYKQKHREENSLHKKTDLIEYQIITKYLTPEHILKEKAKPQEKYGELKPENTFELLNRCFTEFFRDNWELILKKMHYPTINMRVLKSFSDNKVKEVTGL